LNGLSKFIGGDLDIRHNYLPKNIKRSAISSEIKGKIRITPQYDEKR